MEELKTIHFELIVWSKYPKLLISRKLRTNTLTVFKSVPKLFVSHSYHLRIIQIRSVNQDLQLYNVCVLCGMCLHTSNYVYLKLKRLKGITRIWNPLTCINAKIVSILYEYYTTCEAHISCKKICGGDDFWKWNTNSIEIEFAFRFVHETFQPLTRANRGLFSLKTIHAKLF